VRRGRRPRGAFQCFSDIVVRAAASPVEWGERVNAQMYAPDDVRLDAWQLWNWLYGGEPFETANGSSTMTKTRGWWPFSK